MAFIIPYEFAIPCAIILGFTLAGLGLYLERKEMKNLDESE